MHRRLYSNDTTTTNLETLPTTQASNIYRIAYDRTFLTIGWTAGSENNAIVLARTRTGGSTQLLAEPSDGTDYTANLTFGLGDIIRDIIGDVYVVYKGAITGDGITITGLTKNTYYTFRIFEYRGTGSNCRYLKTTATNNPRYFKTAF